MQQQTAASKSKPYRPYRDALNGVLSFGAICLIVYGLSTLGRNSSHSGLRWFAIDLMVQVISIKLASDLIPHGISTPGQNQMDAAVGVLLIACVVLILISEITGLRSTNVLWYMLDGAELALFFSVLVKYLVTLVA